jgi:hypothetical protein
MFKKFKRKRNQDGTFKKDVGWTPWNEAWEYKMSEELKEYISEVNGNVVTNNAMLKGRLIQ